MVDNPDHFHQLGNFDLVETRFLVVMYFEHVPVAVLQLFNTLQYVPQFLVVHVGASDFSKYNNLQQHQNIASMMQRVNKLVKAIDTHHSDGFKGVFLLPHALSPLVSRMAAAASSQESQG